MPKKAYRVRNWKEYNKGLINRGSLTFWFSDEIQKNWQKSENSTAHGNQKYSDAIILCSLTLRQLFRLPLRATQGLMASLAELAKLDVNIPDYSTLSRRSKIIKVNFDIKKSLKARHILIDSTGIRVIGEREWKKLHHGESRYQLWRKLHIAMDADTNEILAATMTESVRLDGNYLPGLIDKIDGPIDQITGDGAYDKKNCYQAAYKRGAKAVFPPQHDACVQRNKIKKDQALMARDATILFINNGEDMKTRRKLWKIENNYHRRSLVETMMSRMKSIFGDEMRSRTTENQHTDLMIRCNIINKMNLLGMPKSERID
ncbi:MAG: IS5 family transposase [Alphaproteobacteria bacterium]|nr:IS5 family transposase [Alphaproteobacteria bacterium]